MGTKGNAKGSRGAAAAARLAKPASNSDSDSDASSTSSTHSGPVRRRVVRVADDDDGRPAAAVPSTAGAAAAPAADESSAGEEEEEEEEGEESTEASETEAGSVAVAANGVAAAGVDSEGAGEEEEEEEEEEEGGDAADVDVDAMEYFDVVGLLGGLTPDEFLGTVWGRKLWCGRASAETFAALKAGFGDGDLAEVLPACRKDSNVAYTPEEMKEIEADYEEQRKTVNQPFCFTDGAFSLREHFIQAFPDLGNDVEVGVYYSRPGGAPMPMHSDMNHNITIQVCGEKEWTCKPGTPNVTQSRAELHRPKNGHERAVAAAGAAPAGALTTYRLRPGSVIYLPPGHWHAVEAVGSEDSFSIDLRVANVLKGRQVAEAIFAGLMERFGAADFEGGSLVREDFERGSQAASLRAMVAHVQERAGEMVDAHRLPRLLPSLRSLSNGMERANKLENLFPGSVSVDVLRRSLFAGKEHAVYAVNQLVALRLAVIDAARLVIGMTSESSLSTVEYMNYAVHCPLALEPAVARLASAGRASLSELEGLTDHPLLLPLVAVLSNAHVLVEVLGGAAGAVGGGVTERSLENGCPDAKRRRTEDGGGGEQ